MSILIVYAGKYGSCAKCAEMLAKLLPRCEIVNLKERRHPDISKYECIIVGGNIRYGLLNRPVKNFILHNVQALRAKISAYFICCGFPKSAKQYFNTNFPKIALEHACAKECFGGELKPDLMTRFDRFVLKAVTSNTEIKKESKLPEIDEEAVLRLANAVKAKLKME